MRPPLIFKKCSASFCVLVGLHAQMACAEDPMHAPLVATTSPTTQASFITGIQTLVFLRHGEKPADDLGQLTAQGLNRAIALSKILPAKYGKPDFIFAPLTLATRAKDGSFSYFYIRPLMTIEPTAISLKMPVQTPFGFNQIDQLNAELMLPKYAHAMIFIAWEHVQEEKAVVKLMAQFGGDAKQIPPWPRSDFDSLYVLRINRTAGQPSKITFTHDHEHLDHLSTTMPSPARN